MHFDLRNNHFLNSKSEHALYTGQTVDHNLIHWFASVRCMELSTIMWCQKWDLAHVYKSWIQIPFQEMNSARVCLAQVVILNTNTQHQITTHVFNSKLCSPCNIISQSCHRFTHAHQIRLWDSAMFIVVY